MPIQNDKILLRLSQTLTAAMDQVLREQLPGLNRSDFIRRALRYTIDNIDHFRGSGADSVPIENEGIESIDKINKVRELHDQLFLYKESLMKEASTPVQIKQVSFLVFLIGEMIFKMCEV